MLLSKRPLILVADDQLLNRLVLQLILEQIGARVTLVSNGREAVDAVIAERPTLIFMDLDMPQVDGFTAAEEIRSICGDDAPPIVAVTSDPHDRRRGRAEAAGMEELMLTPVNIKLIQSFVEKAAGDAALEGAD